MYYSTSFVFNFRIKLFIPRQDNWKLSFFFQNANLNEILHKMEINKKNSKMFRLLNECFGLQWVKGNSSVSISIINLNSHCTMLQMFTLNFLLVALFCDSLCFLFVFDFVYVFSLFFCFFLCQWPRRAATNGKWQTVTATSTETETATCKNYKLN